MPATEIDAAAAAKTAAIFESEEGPPAIVTASPRPVGAPTTLLGVRAAFSELSTCPRERALAQSTVRVDPVVFTCPVPAIDLTMGGSHGLAIDTDTLGLIEISETLDSIVLSWLHVGALDMRLPAAILAELRRHDAQPWVTRRCGGGLGIATLIPRATE